MKYLLTLMSAVCFAGCSIQSTAGLTKDERKARTERVKDVLLSEAKQTLGAFAVQTLSNIASQEFRGEKIDFARSATDALQSSTDGLFTASKVQRVLEAWRLPATAKAAAREVRVAEDLGIPVADTKAALTKALTAATLTK
jgi:hypothetical protein